MVGLVNRVINGNGGDDGDADGNTWEDGKGIARVHTGGSPGYSRNDVLRY